jgi:hypothetical protein
MILLLKLCNIEQATEVVFKLNIFETYMINHVKIL